MPLSRRAELEAKRAAIEAELKAMEEAEDEETEDEGVSLYEHNENRAGKGFPTDIYDIEASSEEEAAERIISCVERTIRKHNLPDTAQIRVWLYNKTHSAYKVSSKKISVEELRNWLRRDMAGKLQKYEDVSLPDRVEVGWIKPDANGRGGLDNIKAMKTHAFESGLCGPISIALGIARVDYQEHIKSLLQKWPGLSLKELKKKGDTDQVKIIKTWECMQNDKLASKEGSKSSNMRMEAAKQLLVKADLPIRRQGFSDYELHKIINTLTSERKEVWGMQIFNENGICLYSTCSFDSEEETMKEAKLVKHWIYLLKSENQHYQLIRSLASFCDTSGKVYCPICKKLRDSKHKCNIGCQICGSSEEHIVTKGCWKKCTEECGRFFAGLECLYYHLWGTDKGCGKQWRCDKCKIVFGRKGKPFIEKSDHHCGDVYCGNCKIWTDPWPDHQCYITTKPPKKPIKKNQNGVDKILYCDFECTQDNIKQQKNKTINPHEVNLVCTQEADGTLWPVYKNISDWFDHLSRKEYAGYTVFFHNSGGYDAQFIAKESTNRGVQFVPQFSQGSRMRTFTLKSASIKNTHVKVLDSACFLLMPLTDFTKTFDLKSKKGFYPHYFNTSANSNWVGKLHEIAPKEFGFDAMSKNTQNEFKQWYEENSQMIWDNAKELEDYCQADVTLLREGFECFRSLVKKVTIDENGIYVDPASYTTLPAVAKAVWRFKHIQKDTIACLPTHLTKLMTPAARGGRTELFYRYWSAKPGERGYYVDFTSLYPWVNRFGIYPKGHPTFSDMLDVTDQETIQKIIFDEGVGVIWCDVTCPQNLRFPVLPMLRNGKLMFDLMERKHTEDDPVVYSSLELKEAILRGYKVTKIHKVCWWTETIVGIFASYVNTFFKIKTESEGLSRIDNSFDAINAAITQEVAEQYQERMIKLNLCEENMKEYMNLFWKGYESCVVEPAVKGCGTDRRTTKEIENIVKQDLKNLTIAKLRTRAMTESEIKQYTQKFADEMGISIDVEQLSKSNSGLRAVAKLFLNSLWGKMGEKLDYNSHEILYKDDKSTLRHIALDQQNAIEDFINISDKCTIVIKKPTERQADAVLNERNIALAIFTTSQARLKLLKEFLEVCDDRALYCDTDSCIFFCKAGEDPQTVLGQSLGTMLGKPTSEFGDKTKFGDVWITEFFSGGPKNYGFRLNTSKAGGEFKCKGFPKNREDVKKQLYYERCRDAILKKEKFTVTAKSCIFRPARFEVATETRTKVYRDSHTKSKPLDFDPNEPNCLKTRPWRDSDKEEYEALLKAMKDAAKPPKRKREGLSASEPKKLKTC